MVGRFGVSTNPDLIIAALVAIGTILAFSFAVIILIYDRFYGETSKRLSFVGPFDQYLPATKLHAGSSGSGYVYFLHDLRLGGGLPLSGQDKCNAGGLHGESTLAIHPFLGDRFNLLILIHLWNSKCIDVSLSTMDP